MAWFLTIGIHVAKAAGDDLDWFRVELSIAMIKTSIPPLCPGNCATSALGRGSKVKLTFPPEFPDVVMEKLGGEVGKSYFVVTMNGNIEQKTFFDFHIMKPTADGRNYFERASNQGTVEGVRCGTHAKYLYFELDYVHFDSADGTQSVILYPQGNLAPNPPQAGGIFTCGGAFETKPVKVPEWADW